MTKLSPPDNFPCSPSFPCIFWCFEIQIIHFYSAGLNPQVIRGCACKDIIFHELHSQTRHFFSTTKLPPPDNFTCSPSFPVHGDTTCYRPGSHGQENWECRGDCLHIGYGMVRSVRYIIAQNSTVANKICIWHCFLVDKGSDRYASPDTGRAEGECLYRRQVPI